MALDRRRLLVRTARLYYEQDLNQAEIGDRLGLSRQKVQRLIRQAREEGVVQIAVHPIIGVYSDLEVQLENQFGLTEVIVVETTAHDNQRTVAKEVGAGAAEYLSRVVRPNDRIVLSWGNSLLGMVNALGSYEKLDAAHLLVIQGLGGLGDPNREGHATQVVTRAARALKAQAVLLPAPAMAASRAAREAYYNDPHVQQVLREASRANLAFVGVGSSSADSIVLPEILNTITSSTLRELTARGAVGAINLRYYDEQGQQISSELDDRVVGLRLSELKRIYRVVGVAGGSAKFDAILGAVRGRLIKVLVTDHVTAQKLLDAKSRRKERELANDGSTVARG